MSYLKEKRKEQKMTQRELAENIGVSRRQVIKWEKKEQMPSPRNLEKLEKILELSKVDLIIDFFDSPISRL